MAGLWPTGMMDTTTLSNQYSQFKKKREKSRDEHGFQYPEQSSYGLIRADPYAPIVARQRKKDDSIILLDEEQSAVNVGDKRKNTDSNTSAGTKKSKVADVIIL